LMNDCYELFGFPDFFHLDVAEEIMLVLIK